MTQVTFPRFKLGIEEDAVPPEVQKRRDAFAMGPLAKRMAEPDKAATLSPEAFGREMFRLHGKAWPQMIALASGAAMQAERDAMEEVK